MDLRCGDFLSEKKCRHKLVVSTSVWSRLLNVSSVLTTKKYSDTFLISYCALGLLTVRVSTTFLILVCFWNMSFFVFILDANFCGTNFFIFQDSVWLVKKSWCVPCCSIYQFYWLSGRCRSGFALWWSFSERNCRHKLVVFTSFLSWLLNVSSVLTSMKYTATFFGLLMRCGFADSSWEH